MMSSVYKLFSSMSKSNPAEAGRKAAVAAIAALTEKTSRAKNANDVVDVFAPANNDVVGLRCIGRLVYMRDSEISRIRKDQKPYYMLSSEFVAVLKRANEDPENYRNDGDTAAFIQGYGEVYFPFLARRSVPVVRATEDESDGGEKTPKE